MQYYGNEVKEIRALVKEFAQSLSSEMDEWWGTNKDIWDGISKKFLYWCEMALLLNLKFD